MTSEQRKILDEVRAIRTEIQQLQTIADVMIDGGALATLQSFTTSIAKMRALQKGAKSKQDLILLRSLEALVDKAVANFAKNNLY